MKEFTQLPLPTQPNSKEETWKQINEDLLKNQIDFQKKNQLKRNFNIINF